MTKFSRSLVVMGFLGGLIWAGSAFGAGPLDAIFQKVDQAPWGEKQAAVKKSLGGSPLLANPNILIAADGELAGRSTLNYLFKEKTGGLYNLAWYVLTPVSDLKAAQKLESDIEKALKARYGKTKLTHVSGKASDVKEAQKFAAERKAADEAIARAKAAKGSELTPEEMSQALGGKHIMDLLPVIFYGKLNYWDGGDIWVVSNLLCSTDGTCYQHLQFVSKDQTRDEAYVPTPNKPFSYTPLDRDQDAVTRASRGLKQ